MAVFDFISGAATFFDDYVGDFINDLAGDFNFDLGGLTDVFSGAITNAAVTAINGGDIGKAALFGAIGGGVDGYTDLGGWGNEIGGAISGYGLAEANDANSLMGALAGAGGEFLQERMSSKTGGSGGNATTTPLKDNGPVPGQDIDANGNVVTESAGGFQLSEKLKSLGLIDTSGKETLLGKALLGGVASVGDQMMQEDLMEKQQEYAVERAKKQADIDHKSEQDRIRFFTNQQNPYRIQRSQ